MKAVRLFLIFVVVFTSAMSVSAGNKGEKTVVFGANLHCASCQAKVEKNIPFEKGVKDLKVDMKAQTITITFREDKNSVENLKKAIEKLSIQVKETPADAKGDKAKACCDSQKKECQKDPACCGKKCPKDGDKACEKKK